METDIEKRSQKHKYTENRDAIRRRRETGKNQAKGGKAERTFSRFVTFWDHAAGSSARMGCGDLSRKLLQLEHPSESAGGWPHLTQSC